MIEDSQKDETKVNLKLAENTQTQPWKQKGLGEIKLEHNYEYSSKVKIEQGFVKRIKSFDD